MPGRYNINLDKHKSIDGACSYLSRLKNIKYL